MQPMNSYCSRCSGCVSARAWWSMGKRSQTGPAALVIAAIRFYQRLISPLLGANCRFRPTCSDYTIQALDKYGLIKGSWLGFKRIIRCHPWHPGGYDPLR